MSEVSIQVQETVENVEIVVQNNVIDVNITRQSGGGGGAVDSVNGQTGVVVLDADDISETATRFWLTSVLKTAYDGAVAWIITNGANILNHISSTSNPHNVTKTQVGLGNVDNTSDVNKPISTATQTALNGKADRFLNVKVPTTAYLTGTTAETEFYRLEFAPNTFSATDILKLHRLVCQKLAAFGTFTIRVKLSTSATMPSGTTDQIAVFSTATNNQLYAPITRTFFITGGNIIGFPFNASAVIDNNVTTAISSTTFDRTVTQYLYVSITLANASDQVRIVGGQISNV